MAIAFDIGTQNSSKSFSVTFSSTGNRLAVLWVPETAFGQVTAVSIGGVSGALFNEYNVGADTDPGFMGFDALWYVANYPSGAQTVTITSSDASLPQMVTLDSFTGADSSLHEVGTKSFSNASTSLTSTITPTVAGSWAVLFGGINRPFLSGTNFSLRSSATGVSTNQMIGDTNGIISGATNITVTQTLSSNIWGLSVAIRPFVSANSNFIAFM